MSNPIMHYFEFAHLPHGAGRTTSGMFCDLAHWVDANIPDGPEKSVALRKLLEGKDAAVRAALEDERPAAEPSPVRDDGVLNDGREPDERFPVGSRVVIAKGFAGAGRPGRVVAIADGQRQVEYDDAPGESQWRSPAALDLIPDLEPDDGPPLSRRCPTCGADPGWSCTRPSGSPRASHPAR